jgi:glutamate-1-semialdehyde 2,1-aminomutase
MLTIGKAIAGGIPTGAYGLSEEVADKVSGRTDLDLIDVGGTLAGNALSVAAMRATLEHVLTDAAFEAMDFSNPAPSNGGDSNAASDPELDDFLHVYLANRDVLMTPFHNMALMCPATTQADVNSHHRVRGLSLNHPLSSCRMLPPSTTSDCPVM